MMWICFNDDRCDVAPVLYAHGLLIFTIETDRFFVVAVGVFGNRSCAEPETGHIVFHVHGGKQIFFDIAFTQTVVYAVVTDLNQTVCIIVFECNPCIAVCIEQKGIVAAII